MKLPLAFLVTRLLRVFIPGVFLANCAAMIGGVSKQQETEGLLRAAQAVEADELIVSCGDDVIVNWTSERFKPPYYLMSVTKSIVALAIGGLIDDGRLHLSDSMSRFFPLSVDDPKRAITVDQILTMTSGLDASFPNNLFRENCVQAALDESVLQTPGEHWSYNNDAVNLLSGIVEKVTGSSLERYIQQALFAPLEIDDWVWHGDACGHTWVMTGLALGPQDLLKIGQLFLNNGHWHGRQIVSETWMKALSSPTIFPDYGRLWWLHLRDWPLASDYAGARRLQIVEANGSGNQIIMIDRGAKCIMVLQTEFSRQPDDYVAKDPSSVVTEFIRFTTKIVKADR